MSKADTALTERSQLSRHASLQSVSTDYTHDRCVARCARAGSLHCICRLRHAYCTHGVGRGILNPFHPHISHHFVELDMLEKLERTLLECGDKLEPDRGPLPPPQLSGAHSRVRECPRAAPHAQFPHARHDTLTRAYACAPLLYCTGLQLYVYANPVHISNHAAHSAARPGVQLCSTLDTFSPCAMSPVPPSLSLSALSSARWPLRPHTSPLPPSTRTSHSMRPRSTAVRAKPPRRRRERPSQHPT